MTKSILLSLLLTTYAIGQVPTSSGPPSIARALSAFKGNVEDGTKNPESNVGEFEQLASEVQLALLEIDPDRVSELNRHLNALDDQEIELKAKLDDLAEGVPLDLLSEGPNTASLSEDTSPKTLEFEKDQLKVREMRIAELERLRKKKRVRAVARD